MSAVVQSLWIGERLSFIEALCIRSFLYHGHEFHLYSYNAIQNVPKGTIVKDASEILPRNAIFRSRSGRISAFADWFRWELLRIRGGVWVDMDIICVRPFIFPDKVVFGWESSTNIAIGVLKFPAHYMLSTAMAKACENVNLFQPIDTTKSAAKKIFRKLVFGKKRSRQYTRFMEPGGPAYFTKFIKYYGLEEFAKPIDWFYPISSFDWKDIFETKFDLRCKVEKSYAVHLWNDKLRRDPDFNKDEPPLDGTLIGYFASRYL